MASRYGLKVQDMLAFQCRWMEAAMQVLLENFTTSRHVSPTLHSNSSHGILQGLENKGPSALVSTELRYHQRPPIPKAKAKAKAKDKDKEKEKEKGEDLKKQSTAPAPSPIPSHPIPDLPDVTQPCDGKKTRQTRGQKAVGFYYCMSP